MAGKKLLVADDSLTIQKVIRLALTNEGYDIHAVSDGNHALQQIATFRPNVILIDVSLPGKSAFEVKREINLHGEGDEIKFILMSSAFERIDEKQIEEVRFHARLTKPFDPAQLRQTLSDAIRITAPTTQSKSRELPPLPPLPFESDENYDGFEIQEAHSDPLTAPIEPEELPPLPSVPIENVLELWESNSNPSDPTRTTLPPLPSSDSDIKQLAEITLSGRAPEDLSPPEFDWSIDEGLPSLTAEVSVAPPSIELPNFDLPPQVAMTDQDSNSYSNFEISQPNTPPAFQRTKTDLKIPPPPAGAEAFPGTIKVGDQPQNPPQPLFSSEEVEKLVREQVQATLEKMAKTILPSIAEKIIKDEIHRLLTETDQHPS